MHILSLVQKIMIKVLNFKLVTMYEHEDLETFLHKLALQIDGSVVKKVKDTVPQTNWLQELNGK